MARKPADFTQSSQSPQRKNSFSAISAISALELLALDLSPDREYLDQCDTRNEPTDVCRIRDSAGTRVTHVTKNDLIDDPDTDRDKRRNRRQKIEDDRPHLSLRKQQH